MAEIGWSQNLAILTRQSDDDQREFYLRMTRAHGWSKDGPIHQIENGTYEKTLASQSNDAQTLPVEVGPPAKLAPKDESRGEPDGLRVGMRNTA